jgi:AAA15 family ATPase/GTPase
MEEESEGTQRLIHLVPSLFILKQDSEIVVFLDELDRRLHPLLSRYFVETAINCRAKGNQLVFTTHDTNLLDLDLLRRDEIWFIEKDSQGASSCYSLAEFKIRPDLKIEKGYLNARFGAIPFLGDIQNLGWVDRNSELSNANA